MKSFHVKLQRWLWVVFEPLYVGTASQGSEGASPSLGTYLQMAAAAEWAAGELPKLADNKATRLLLTDEDMLCNYCEKVFKECSL